MAPYFDHMHQKSTHERRTHAMRVAGVVTALIFAGWITTIGLRTNSSDQPQVAQDNSSAAQTAAAITSQADQQQAVGGTGTAQLVVATSTN
jgi:hypothetical protein